MNVLRHGRQRCDYAYVPEGNLDRHPELGITTQYTPRMPARRKGMLVAGRIIRNGMVSADNVTLLNPDSQTYRQEYSHSKEQLQQPKLAGHNKYQSDKSTSRRFFEAFGDGTSYRPESTFTSSSRNNHPSLQPIPSPLRRANLQIQSDPASSSLPPGPYCVNNEGWCVPYMAKKQLSQVEDGVRAVSFDTPDWFKPEQIRVNEREHTLHTLGGNGRKEQVMSEGCPEWFIGDRTDAVERKRIARQNPNFSNSNTSPPKNLGIRRSRTGSANIDHFNHDGTATEEFPVGATKKRLNCFINGTTINNAQISRELPSFLQHKWVDERPRIKSEYSPSQRSGDLGTSVSQKSLTQAPLAAKAYPAIGLWSLGKWNGRY